MQITEDDEEDSLEHFVRVRRRIGFEEGEGEEEAVAALLAHTSLPYMFLSPPFPSNELGFPLWGGFARRLSCKVHRSC